MQARKAQVKAQRLVLDEPTELPEGKIVYLVALDEPGDLDDAERVRLDSALENSMADAKAGSFVDAGQVVARLRASA